MFLLLEKQICLNPLESGRVVKSNAGSADNEELEVLIPLNRVVLLNQIKERADIIEVIVLIPLNRVVLLN